MISQKATILCIYEILKKYSDENHIISAEKIREKLKVIYDVSEASPGNTKRKKQIKRTTRAQKIKIYTPGLMP